LISRSAQTDHLEYQDVESTIKTTIPDEECAEPTEAEKEQWRRASWEITKKENAASLKFLGIHEGCKPPPVAITNDNYADKRLPRQKWGFNIIPRKKHRAFYGSVLDCQIGRNCENEPFYQVKWFSYKKTGQCGWAYGRKTNYKWACPGCADKWSKRIIREKDIQYKLPKLPIYVSPALASGQWDKVPTVYDGRFC